MRIVLVLMLLLCGLQAKLWFGDGGMQETHALQQQLDQQMRKNRELAQHNAAFSAEVDSLKQGLGAVEAEARRELGLVKPGERFYQFIGGSIVAKPAQMTPTAP